MAEKIVPQSFRVDKQIPISTSLSGFISHGATLAAVALLSHAADKALGLPAGSLATAVPFLMAMTKF